MFFRNHKPAGSPGLFRRLKISHALAIAVSLPLVVALVLAGVMVFERQQVAREMSSIGRLGPPIILLSAVVHAAQKERGASAVFLASNGAKFGPELKAQRANTDVKQKALDAFLATADLSSMNPVWQDQLAKIQTGFNQRSALRRQVDQQQVSADEAVRAYTDTNVRVLDLIKYTGHLSKDAEVANAMTAFSYFLMGKERVGIERAVGASGFAVGQFSAADLQKLNTLIAMQNLYFKDFSDLAVGDQTAILPLILQSKPAQKVQTMRDHAMAGTLSGYSGADFFAAQTKKLALLKQGENRLSADLMALLSRKESRALRERNVLLGVMALVFLAISSFSIGLIRSISKCVQEVVKAAERMAEGDMEGGFPMVTKNEIGRIISALVQLKDSIIEGRRQEALAREKEREMQDMQARQTAEKLAAEQEKAALELRRDRELLEEQELRKQETRAAEKAIEAAHKKEQDTMRKKEQKAAAEIAKVVHACGEGDFSKVLATDDKEGVFAEICAGVNRIGQFTKQNLEQVEAALSALKNGEISYRMVGKFDGAFSVIQHDMNEAFESLSSVIYQIDSSSENVRASTNEIAEASTSLATRTEAAAANLEETASSVDELSDAVHRTNELATTANASIVGIENHTKKSTEIVKETIAAITGIKDASHSISQTITVIDEIAFQTNLLALNAGVEAARAGDAGRGFAVVASEIRDLAAKSSAAAHEISALMKNNETQVADGVRLVDQTGEALTRIDMDISAISQSMGEIAASATLQSGSIDEIKLATTQLDKVTQENAAMFEETTALNVSLKAETEKLRNIMANFQINDQNSGALQPNVVALHEAPAAPLPRARSAAAPAAMPASNWEDF